MEHGSDLRPGRVRRTRPKAARLVPQSVDEGSTDRLFVDECLQDEVRGRHFAGSADKQSTVRAANEDVVLDLVDGHAPLLRYEWHTRAGETMIVEAAWPFDTSPSTALDRSAVRREPAFDYRNAS